MMQREYEENQEYQINKVKIKITNDKKKRFVEEKIYNFLIK